MAEKLPPTKEAIEKVLDEGGWRHVRIAESTWRTKVRSGDHTFPLLVYLDPEGFLTFAIVPYLKSPEADGPADRLYRRLLELNHSMMMAKFSIDDDLDVLLSVEHPLHDLDRSEVDDALNALAHYATKHHEELAQLIATEG